MDSSLLPIASTLINFLPETVRPSRPTVEDTSLQYCLCHHPDRVSLCLYPSTVYDTYYVGS